MSEEEIIKNITYKVSMKDTDVYAPILYEEIQCLLDLYKKKSRMVEIMAEHLTTDTHGKDWVIKYFEDEVELENGETND